MPYAYQLESCYAVDAAWLYCRAIDYREGNDDECFEAAVEKTGLEREDAIVSLLRPHLSKLGFSSEAWALFVLTEDYIAYEGFALRDYYDRDFVYFDADSLFSWAENYPESKTMHFSRAHERLVRLLDIDEVTPVDLLLLERWEQPEEEEEEEEET